MLLYLGNLCVDVCWEVYVFNLLLWIFLGLGVGLGFGVFVLIVICRSFQVVIEIVKLVEDGQGVILCLFEVYNMFGEVILELDLVVQWVEWCGFLEIEVDFVMLDDG